MSLGDQSALVMIAALLLYPIAGLVIGFRAGPLRASFAMVAISLMPLIWQATFTDSDAPGFGVLFIMSLPVTGAVLAIGLIAAVVRVARSPWRRSAQESSDQTGGSAPASGG